MDKIPDIPFKSFPKIPRLNREVIVTEKIDGTNSSIYITKDCQIFAASKNQWITIDNDNHSFAAWVEEHKDELLHLGPGLHRGEFYGFGIQKNPAKLKEKRLALFNTKWTTDPKMNNKLPKCCDVVPILYQGIFSVSQINLITLMLRDSGSVLNKNTLAEGVIVYHAASGTGFKVTCLNDSSPKSLGENK